MFLYYDLPVFKDVYKMTLRIFVLTSNQWTALAVNKSAWHFFRKWKNKKNVIPNSIQNLTTIFLSHFKIKNTLRTISDFNKNYSAYYWFLEKKIKPVNSVSCEQIRVAFFFEMKNKNPRHSELDSESTTHTVLRSWIILCSKCVQRSIAFRMTHNQWTALAVNKSAWHFSQKNYKRPYTSLI